MENLIQFKNSNIMDRTVKSLTFITRLFLLHMLGMGLFTYLLTFVIVEFMEKVLKKRDERYQITSRKIAIIVLFVYLIEQYLILKDLEIIYWSVTFLLLGIYILSYLFFNFKFKIKEMWFNLYILATAIIFLDFFNNNYLNIEIKSGISHIIFFISLIYLGLFLFSGYKNKVFPSLLMFKWIYYLIDYLYPIFNVNNRMQFRKNTNIIISFVIMFLLKKLYDDLKSFKVITLEEKLHYIFYVIIGIYFSIQIFLTVIIDY